MMLRRRTLLQFIAVVVLISGGTMIAHWSQPVMGGGTAWLSLIEQPVASVSVAVGSWLRGLSTAVRNPGRLRELEQHVAALLVQRAELERMLLEVEADTAERATHSALQQRGTTTLAYVISGTFDGAHRTLTVSFGSKDAVEPGDLVLANGALVGVIAFSGVQRAVVRLLNDGSMRTAVETAHDPETIGILEASPSGGYLLTHIPRDRDVAVGAVLVSGRMNTAMTAGFPIGTIADLRVDADGFFKSAAVEPMIAAHRLVIVTIFHRTP